MSGNSDMLSTGSGSLYPTEVYYYDGGITVYYTMRTREENSPISS